MLRLREASRGEAKSWFSQYHYTGTAAGHRFLAVEDDEGVVAIVGIGRGGNRFGVADKFGLASWPGNLELTRLACSPAAARNTASRAISMACKALAEEGVAWLFSYSDTAQGHHGGIYQAVNAVYVGTDAKQWVNFALDGVRVSKRAVSGRFGHTRWPEVRDIAKALGHDLQKVPWQPKHTYILPIASDRKVRKSLCAHLATKSLPYPKRGEVVVPTPYRNYRPKS